MGPHASFTEGIVSWHPIGTCKMGGDSLAVVDPELKVRGVEGLRVADSSLLPTMCSPNTNAGSITIGERAADLVMSEHRARVRRPLAAAQHHG
jgi:choline dehydrogenase